LVEAIAQSRVDQPAEALALYGFPVFRTGQAIVTNLLCAASLGVIRDYANARNPV